MTAARAELLLPEFEGVHVPVDVAEWLERLKRPWRREDERLLEREGQIALAIGFRAVGARSTANSGNLASIALPTGHTTNDILFLFAAQGDNVASTVSGYTLLGSTTNGTGAAFRIFGKRDGGSEAAPTLTHTGGSTSIAWIAAYSGVDSTLTIGTGAGAILRDIQFQNGASAGSTTCTAPALSNVVSGDMRIAAGMFSQASTDGATTNNWGVFTGFTERADYTSAVTGSIVTSGALDDLLATGSAGSATSTIAYTGTITNMVNIGCQLALSSATGGAAALRAAQRVILQAVARAGFR